MPIPVNEGNDECRKCEHFDMGMGCVPTYINGLPPCGRDIIIPQKQFIELLSNQRKGVKQQIIKFMRNLK